MENRNYGRGQIRTENNIGKVVSLFRRDFLLSLKSNQSRTNLIVHPLCLNFIFNWFENIFSSYRLKL